MTRGQTKTDRIVASMQGRASSSIAEIHAVTGLKANEISGILASLQRQERVQKLPHSEDQTRQRWALIRAEKVRASRPPRKPCSRTINLSREAEMYRNMLFAQDLFLQMHRMPTMGYAQMAA